MNAVLSPIGALGRAVLGFLAAIGRVTIFALHALSHILRPPFYGRELAQALLHIGYLSLPVVGMTAIFTGGALALQIYSGGARFNAEAVVPQIVAIGMVRELGPVLVGLMIAARVTSSIAAEVATMKVTEQIDALVTLSTHPMKYLAVPRIVAAVLTLPVLVAVGENELAPVLKKLPRRWLKRLALLQNELLPSDYEHLGNKVTVIDRDPSHRDVMDPRNSRIEVVFLRRN